MSILKVGLVSAIPAVAGCVGGMSYLIIVGKVKRLEVDVEVEVVETKA